MVDTFNFLNVRLSYACSLCPVCVSLPTGTLSPYPIPLLLLYVLYVMCLVLSTDLTWLPLSLDTLLTSHTTWL